MRLKVQNKQRSFDDGSKFEAIKQVQSKKRKVRTWARINEEQGALRLVDNRVYGDNGDSCLNTFIGSLICELGFLKF